MLLLLLKSLKSFNISESSQFGGVGINFKPLLNSFLVALSGVYEVEKLWKHQSVNIVRFELESQECNGRTSSKETKNSYTSLQPFQA